MQVMYEVNSPVAEIVRIMLNAVKELAGISQGRTYGILTNGRLLTQSVNELALKSTRRMEENLPQSVSMPISK